MEFFLIYCYIVLTHCWFIPIVLVAFTAIMIIMKFFLNDPEVRDETKNSYNKWHGKWFKLVFIFAIITTLMVPLVPTKKDLAYIIGGGVVWKVAQDKQVQKLPHNIAKMANDFAEKAQQEELK